MLAFCLDVQLFSSHSLSCYSFTLLLSHTPFLLSLCSLSLPSAFTSPDCFRKCFKRGGETLLRCLHYPGSQRLADTQSHLHAHTDGTLLTVLMQDDAGGLEVLVDGDWRAVPVIPDSFVINVGDLMMFWTNDRWKSNWHRVNRVGGDGRLSFPLFFTPDRDTMIECHSKFLGKGESPKYSPVSIAEFNDLRMKRLEIPLVLGADS